jgi:hypothetical protein
LRQLFQDDLASEDAVDFGVTVNGGASDCRETDPLDPRISRQKIDRPIAPAQTRAKIAAVTKAKAKRFYARSPGSAESRHSARTCAMKGASRV